MRRPGIRTVLLGLSLLLVSLPIGAIFVARVYESALVRQTETGLITQSALIAAQYRQELLRLAPQTVASSDFGRPINSSNAPATDSAKTSDTLWRPRSAELDLTSSEILPRAPASHVDGVADEYCLRVGRLIQPVLEQAQVTTLAGLRVVDFTGVVVASTGNDIDHYLGQTVEMREALSGRGMSVLRQRELEGVKPPYSSISRGASLRVHVTTPVTIGARVVGAVQAVRTPRTLGAALYYNKNLLMFAGLGVLATALLAGLIASYAIVRPIKQLREQSLRAIHGGTDAMTPLARPVTRDIEQLSGALSTMAKSLQQRADYMRQFATHVSHEFKNPLSAMQGSIELLQDHRGTMTEREQSRFLSNIDADVKRLRRMVDELLSLTLAVNDNRPPATGSLSAATADVVAAFVDENLITEHQNRIANIHVAVATSTLVSIFSSLVRNSFEHGADQVTLEFELLDESGERIPTRVAQRIAKDTVALEAVDGLEHAASWVAIHFRDDGPGIGAEHHERIFDPYFTTRKDSGDHGLGLAIVASLVRSHAGTIRSRPCEVGAWIEIRLPID